VLRASLADVTVRVNGQIIYQQVLENKGLLKTPYASLWHIVPMPTNAKGKAVAITFKSPYSKMNGSLNPIYYGNKGDLILFLIILLILHQLFIEVKLKQNKLAKYNLLSIAALFTFVSLELLKFNFISMSNATIFVRLGVLCFIILLYIGVGRQFFERLKKSYQAEFFEIF